MTCWFADFNAGKTQLVSSDQSNTSSAIDVKMDGSVLDENEKPSFKILDCLSLLNCIEAVVSTAKTGSKKIWALIRFMKLGKLQKQVYRTVGWTLAASLEPLGYLQNVASF